MRVTMVWKKVMKCAVLAKDGAERRKTSALGGWMVAGMIGGAALVHASPSGLNNTPTADTCSEQTLVLQAWEGFGRGMTPDNWVGAKYGLFSSSKFGGAEIGVDWNENGDPTRSPVFQGKYAIDIAEAGPRVCGGIANVSGDKDRNGEPMPYGVLSYDIKGLFRVHAGYGFQKNNDGAFGGLDRTFNVSGLNVMLCGDVIQTNDRKDALLAPGIKIGPFTRDMDGIVGTIIRHTVFETWVTFPTDGGTESYVAKLNFILGF